MAKSGFMYALCLLVFHSYLVLIIKNGRNYLWEGCNQYFFILYFFDCFFLITVFLFYSFGEEIESGGMRWLDGRRLVFPQGALERLQASGVVLRRHRACMSGKPSKASLGRNITSLQVRNGEQQPARSKAQKGLLKFAASQKVIDLIKTQVGAVFKEAMQTLFIEYHSGVFS